MKKRAKHVVAVAVILMMMTLMPASAFILDPGAGNALQDVIIQKVVLAPDGSGGIDYDIYINTDSGQKPAFAPVGSAGSVFELWIDTDSEGLVKLDTKWVGPDGVAASAFVHTEDQWNEESSVEVNGVNVTMIKRRTRIDKGYVVEAKATRISDAATAPQSLSEVQFHWMYLDPVGDATDVADRFSFVGGEANVNYVVEDQGVLTATANTYGPNYGISGFSQDKIARKDLFTIDTIVDTVIPVSSNLVHVEIVTWPMTTSAIQQMGEGGVLEPFDAGQVFTDRVKDIYVQWDAIYPGTTVYVAIIKNGAGTGSRIEILDDINPTNAPKGQSTVLQGNQGGQTTFNGRKISEQTISAFITRWGDGDYTIKIMHADLPFEDSLEDVELSSIEFTVNRVIDVKGTIGTIGSDDN